MKLVLLGIAFLAALSKAAPSIYGVGFTVTAFETEMEHQYLREHDVVSLTVPLNGVNFEHGELSNESNWNVSVFFVEADVKENGERDYKGLYLLKGNDTTKILETGTDSAADMSNSKDVYVSATDGLYVYNSDSGKVERYGSVTDSLISVLKPNSSVALYVLTADNVVYKVTGNGENKVKVDDIKDAKQFVLDNADNLYYYGADKQPYVLTEDGVKKIEGLPANPISVSLTKPSFIQDKLVSFMSDNKMYFVKADGTSAFQSENKNEMTLTASATEVFFIQYFAYQNIIVDLTFPNLISESNVDFLKLAFKSKADKIDSIVSRLRSSRHQ